MTTLSILWLSGSNSGPFLTELCCRPRFSFNSHLSRIVVGECILYCKFVEICSGYTSDFGNVLCAFELFDVMFHFYQTGQVSSFYIEII